VPSPKKLKPETVKLLRKIEAHMLEEPKRVDMCDWARPSNKPSCGTTACIAGWAILMSVPKKKLLALSKANPGASEWDYAKLAETKDIENAARNKLKLTKQQANRLFIPYQGYPVIHGSWPELLWDKYMDAATPRRKAKVVVDRIERFIETGGAE
jgi:hypothetical protein